MARRDPSRLERHGGREEEQSARRVPHRGEERGVETAAARSTGTPPPPGSGPAPPAPHRMRRRPARTPYTSPPSRGRTARRAPRRPDARATRARPVEAKLDLVRHDPARFPRGDERQGLARARRRVARETRVLVAPRPRDRARGAGGRGPRRANAAEAREPRVARLRRATLTAELHVHRARVRRLRAREPRPALPCDAARVPRLRRGGADSARAAVGPIAPRRLALLVDGARGPQRPRPRLNRARRGGVLVVDHVRAGPPADRAGASGGRRERRPGRRLRGGEAARLGNVGLARRDGAVGEEDRRRRAVFEPGAARVSVELARLGGRARSVARDRGIAGIRRRTRIGALPGVLGRRGRRRRDRRGAARERCERREGGPPAAPARFMRNDPWNAGSGGRGPELLAANRAKKIAPVAALPGIK